MTHPFSAQVYALLPYITAYTTMIERQLLHPLRDAELPIPPEVEDFHQRIETLAEVVSRYPSAEIFRPLDSKWLPLVKRILITIRRELAVDRDRILEHVHHGPTRDQVGEQVRTIEMHLHQPPIASAQAAKVPRLTDFLSLQAVERLAPGSAMFASREYDEKFHILNAPSLFLPDLHYYREKCDLRETSVAAAFVDIDNFKAFNTTHLHHRVDRDMLPKFMRTVEAHVYGRGYAYRQGGDEYLVLLPNADHDSAVRILDALRTRIAHLSYLGINDKTTVSVGLCIVGENSALTDGEVLERANKAAAFAKDKGKNRVATYGQDSCDDGALFIASPPEGASA